MDEKEKNEAELEETFEDDEEEDEESGTVGQWLKDNMRIIISILIVIAIAGGVYSFSKRAEAPKEKGKTAGIEAEKDSDGTSEEIALEENKEEKAAEKETVVKKDSEKKEEKTSSVSTSQETADSFVETAGRGEGTTHLARRALANYLEKNPDSSLTAEHKIYIEDYLRKQIGRKSVRIGSSVEFSKNDIQKAIEKSKGLSEKQLKNLHKYAVRVNSLS
jgi:hypothetical protein